MSNLNDRLEYLNSEKENKILYKNTKALEYLIEKLANNIIYKDQNSYLIINNKLDINVFDTDIYPYRTSYFVNVYKLINNNKKWFEDKFKENNIKIEYDVILEKRKPKDYLLGILSNNKFHRISKI